MLEYINSEGMPYFITCRLYAPYETTDSPIKRLLIIFHKKNIFHIYAFKKNMLTETLLLIFVYIQFYQNPLKKLIFLC